MANDLARHPPEIAVDLARLFEQLKLSLNKQKEIITLMGEIALREDVSIRQVLSCKTLQQILTDEDLDRSQKGRQIRHYLRQRRFPRIVKAEQHYHAQLKKLKLNPDIQLIPPKDFEGTCYRLNLNFTNLDHLKMLQSALDKLAGHPSFTRIVENRSD